jgi:hypothetical protein
LENRDFDVAADQGNDIQEKRTDVREDDKKWANGTMTELKRVVSGNGCHIITGFSANNEIMTMFYNRERSETDIEFYGGLDVKVTLVTRSISLTPFRLPTSIPVVPRSMALGWKPTVPLLAR